MKLNRRIIVVALGVLATTAGAEAWVWCATQRAAKKVLTGLEQKMTERRQLMRETPAPTAASEEAVLARIEAVRSALEEMRAELDPSEDTASNAAGAKPVEEYFKIAAFVESARAEAALARVAVRPGDRFGFASYASEGPPPELVPAVARQRIEVQRLLAMLLDARPDALLALQRERPLTPGERTQRNGPGGPGPATVSATRSHDAGPAAGDFFDLDPAISIRRPGLVETDAFRLEFTGRTTTLRALLNRLAVSHWPVVVRSIEAEPSRGGTPGSPSPGIAATASVPLVSPNPTRFTVVVEVLVLPPSEARSES